MPVAAMCCSHDRNERQHGKKWLQLLQVPPFLIPGQDLLVRAKVVLSYPSERSTDTCWRHVCLAVNGKGGCSQQNIPLILGRMSVMKVPSRVSSEDCLDTVSDPSGKSWTCSRITPAMIMPRSFHSPSKAAVHVTFAAPGCLTIARIRRLDMIQDCQDTNTAITISTDGQCPAVQLPFAAQANEDSSRKM